MAKLTKQDVLHVARLARLELDDEEVAQLQTELSDILSMVEQLKDVDVKGMEPVSQVTGLTNVTRDDVVKVLPYSNEQLMQNTPDTHNDGSIKVKRVLS